ncbi:GGDEF domain-containing protein [Myxosarcina sp. GI1]|uniref:GGDEF domain-containing protein n=1 Tax=Myxosarcina sp. GI1 TaxID=1541065 RepID=UPI00055D9B08|nr:diguanylate cyclase [Myxosarcina sp. GI1]
MKNFTVKIVNYLENQSKLSILTQGLILTLIIGTIDYFVVIDFSLSIFYLLPTVLVAWYAGIWYGLAISIISSCSWLINDFTVTKIYYPYFRFWNIVVRFIFFSSITYLLAALKTAYEREKRFAQTDALTGITNRRYFFDLLQQELNLALRYEKIFTVAYFDLDNFKLVNDRYGHAQGDELLKLIAEITTQTIRRVDIFARIGGDEFALLLPETDFAASQTALQRLQTELLMVMEFYSYPVTFSIGAITFVRQLNSIDEIIRSIDSLMYEVKSSSKNDIKHELY